MMKKGSIAAVLFVLIVGIVGAVFLYGGGSSETGAMLLETTESPSPTGTTSTTLMGSGCVCSGCTGKAVKDPLGQFGDACCHPNGQVSPGVSCNEHCTKMGTGVNAKGKGQIKCTSGACTGADCTPTFV